MTELPESEYGMRSMCRRWKARRVPGIPLRHPDPKRRRQAASLLGRPETPPAIRDVLDKFVFVSTQGRVLTGMLVDEDDDTVTLADTHGEPHVIARHDIDDWHTSGRSSNRVCLICGILRKGVSWANRQQ